MVTKFTAWSTCCTSGLGVVVRFRVWLKRYGQTDCTWVWGVAIRFRVQLSFTEW